MNVWRRIAKPNSLLLSLLIVTSILLAIGLVSPLMTIKKLVFLRHSFSVVSGIYDLLVGGKVLLFVIVAGFSLVFPLLKLGFLYAVLLGFLRHSPKTRRYLHLLHDYGRWAMLDVFVVALLIVSIKLGAIASVQIHFGFYIFCVAVLLIMVCTQLTTRILDRQMTAASSDNRATGP